MSIKKNVDVQPGAGVPAIFHCSQGDKGTRIILGLLNNNDSYTIPEGTTAIIRGSRADGTLFEEVIADIDTTTEIKFNLTEDMTSVAGPVECEAVMTSGSANVIGTANFIINVEKSPASIGSVFPGTDAATTWLIDKLENEPLNSLNGESVVDAINGGSGSGLTEDIKTALLACFEKVAWIDEDGQDYYDALYNALYPPADLVSISAVYTQSGTVYNTDTLDSLKGDLVVTATYTDSSTATIPSADYTLSGTLTEGTSTITVTYAGLTDTFTVTVSVETPLYQLQEVATTSLMNLTASLQDVDEVTIDKTGGNGSIICFNNDGTIALAPPSGATWFSLSAGDTWTMQLLDITYNNLTASNKFNIALRNDSNSEIIKSGDISIASTGEGALADIEVSGTVSSDTGNLTLSSYVHRAMSINFKFRFYVNGEWYA